MRKPNKKKATCHPDKPHAARGFCSNCYAKWLRENNEDYAKQQNENTKSWFDKHPAYHKEYKKEEVKRKGGAVYQRKLDLKKLYGITPETYEELLLVQSGRCAICKKPQGERRLGVDHCHESNNIRGLLCLSCNCGLGYFKDSIANLQMAIAYLER